MAVMPNQTYRLPDGTEARVIKVSGRGRNRHAYVAHDGNSKWMPVRLLLQGELIRTPIEEATSPDSTTEEKADE